MDFETRAGFLGEEFLWLRRAAFLTEKIAGEIDGDTVELLPHVASADLDSVNLTAEREAATKVISAMRTVAWWILKRGLDF